MATWDQIKLPDEKCATCESVYEVTERHWPVREPSTVHKCNVCGAILREVPSGTADFMYSIKERGRKP